jgi:hypothetical protein
MKFRCACDGCASCVCDLPCSEFVEKYGKGEFYKIIHISGDNKSSRCACVRARVASTNLCDRLLRGAGGELKTVAASAVPVRARTHTVTLTCVRADEWRRIVDDDVAIGLARRIARRIARRLARARQMRSNAHPYNVFCCVVFWCSL